MISGSAASLPHLFFPIDLKERERGGLVGRERGEREREEREREGGGGGGESQWRFSRQILLQPLLAWNEILPTVK